MRTERHVPTGDQGAGDRQAPTARPARRRHLVLAAVAAGLVSLPALTGGLAGADPAATIEEKREQAREISDRLDELDIRLSELDEQANEAQLVLDDNEAEIAEAEDEVAATRAALDDRQAEVRRYAVDAYVGGNSGESASVLMSASTNEASQKRGYLTAASDSKAQLVADLTEAEAALEARIDDLETARDEAAATAAELDAARDEAEAAVEEQQRIKAAIDDELADLIRAEDERKAAEAAAAARRAEERARLASLASVTPTTAAAAGAGAAAPSTSSTGSTGTTAAPAAPTAPAAPPTTAAPPPVDEPEAPVDPTPAPEPTPEPQPPAPAPTTGAAAAIAAAKSQLGVRYVWGASSPGNGFDCSGLTMWAWSKGGKSLPHSSRMQYSMTQRISMSDIQPGDLIFYGKPQIHHVALYIGNGQIIHAPNSRSVVRIDSVYYWNELVGAGRIR